MATPSRAAHPSPPPPPTPYIIWFTRSGDEKWFGIENPILLNNMLFHKGELYATTLPTFSTAKRPHSEWSSQLYSTITTSTTWLRVETPRGDLLGIWRERDACRTREDRLCLSVKVYKVVEEEEKHPLCLSACDFLPTLDDSQFHIFFGRRYSANLLREEADDLRAQ